MEKKFLCFLIDDDEDDQEIFIMAVREVSPAIECVTAGNCMEALEKLEDQGFNPQCIFIDINMPRINGIACLKAIRKIPRLNGCRIFMYSTAADPGIIEESKALGADDFIRKPTSMGELVDILKLLFNSH